MKHQARWMKAAFVTMPVCFVAGIACAGDATTVVTAPAAGSTILGAVLGILGNPAVVTLIATVAAYYVAKLFAGPKWAPYEGLMISAVKFAEKAIPDGTLNAGLARLDAALREFARVYEAQKGAPAAASLLDAVKTGLPVVHANLEANGNL